MNSALSGLLILACLIGVVVGLAYTGIKVMEKTGHSSFMGLLLFMPGANLILLIWLAFSEWPVEAEVRQLRDSVRRMTNDETQRP